MVQSNDFRRYSYVSDASYALNAFNQTRSSAAPKLRPDTGRGLKVAPNSKRKSLDELQQEQKVSFRKMLYIVGVTVLCIAMLSGVLFTYVQKHELNCSIRSSKNDIAIAHSENVSLNAELESMVSVSQIDAYAVENLGMTRLQSNQIKYIDSTEFGIQRAAAISAAGTAAPEEAGEVAPDANTGN
jgi:cell division protein FtsL